ncbi:response regulator [Chloroflexota bacterium]
MEKARIMVVDDEAVLAESIEMTLQLLGYEVSCVATSGMEAVARAAETYSDLVLMDIRLQGNLDGVETADRLHRDYDMPIIFPTGSADDNTLERAKHTEPYGYILKPFEVSALHSTIEIALYKHKTQRESREREQLLSAMWRSIGEGVIAADEHEKITFMNPVAADLPALQKAAPLSSLYPPSPRRTRSLNHLITWAVEGRITKRATRPIPR